MKKISLFILITIVCVSLVLGTQITNFLGTTNPETINFNANTNITRNISIPLNQTVLLGRINLTIKDTNNASIFMKIGTFNNNFDFSQTFNFATPNTSAYRVENTSITTGFNVSAVNDSNYDTFTYLNQGQQFLSAFRYYMYFTLNNVTNASNVVFNIKFGITNQTSANFSCSDFSGGTLLPPNFESCWNWNISNWTRYPQINSIGDSCNNFTFTRSLNSSCVAPNGSVIIKSDGDGEFNDNWNSGTGANITLYEAWLTYNNGATSYSTDITNSLITAYNSGNCDCVGCFKNSTSCGIPFLFSSVYNNTLIINALYVNTTNGTTSVSNISFQVNSPSGTFNSPTNVPISINVSILGLTNISYCFYNVTYSNLTITNNNTQIVNLTNAFLTVPDFGSYIFNIQCNDTSGTTNRTSSNFSVVSNPGGGGGGYTATSYNQSSNIGVTVPNAGNWTMSSSGLTNYYDLQMTASSSRSEPVLFQNLGTSTRKMTLSCVNVNGSICQYVTFPSSFDLPVLRDIKTAKDIGINLPSGTPNGDYAFNIFAKDDLGNSQVITFITTVGDFGFITNAIVKAGSSLNINGINVPYLIIAIFVGVILFIGSYFLLRKKSYGVSVSFLIGIITAILTIILI